MKRNKNNSGITLIALVVTIIVLLVLAGVSIGMLTGQNGILNKSAEAKEKTDISRKDEQRKLAQAEALMNTEKTTYKGITLPEGFAPTKVDGEDSIDDGLVIIDGYGNEYVWIEVPKIDTIYSTAGTNVTSFTDEEYTKIEMDLHEYTKNYRTTSYSDVYDEDNTNGWYVDSSTYDIAKKKMLKSVYENGGFWVGRYEAGIEDEANRRMISSSPATLVPVSKKNAYPYNRVTRTQAKMLAEQVESGSYTSSLMFGVQWDLILKYIETKKINTVSDIKIMLNSNSISIGNYNNNLYNITNTKAKYSRDFGSNFTTCPYSKTSNASVLLTTGADEKFSLMNIYDMAGNVWEWTLEKASYGDGPCTCRGGSCVNDGSVARMGYRGSSSTSNNNGYVGFRISLY